MNEEEATLPGQLVVRLSLPAFLSYAHLTVNTIPSVLQDPIVLFHRIQSRRSLLKADHLVFQQALEMRATVDGRYALNLEETRAQLEVFGLGRTGLGGRWWMVRALTLLMEGMREDLEQVSCPRCFRIRPSPPLLALADPASYPDPAGSLANLPDVQRRCIGGRSLDRRL